MELTNEQRTLLKGRGVLSMKDGEHFSCRVVIPAGKMTASQAEKLGEVCRKYGRGYFTLTQRANVQIPWLLHEDLDAVARELETVGLAAGGAGMRVRPAHNCRGPVCRFHLYDTESVAEQINERFYKGYYDIRLPAKFRIEISGCPNNCAKTRLACFGLQGKRAGLVAVSIGGCAGRRTVVGSELPGLYSIPEALNLLEKGLLFYRENGENGERFAQTVERIGFEQVKRYLTANL